MPDLDKIKSSVALKVQKLALAWEDINFARIGVEKFIKADHIHEEAKNARDIKEYLFYASIISYGKPFTDSRRTSLGALKIKDIPTLKLAECREIHDDVIKIRNKTVAHNDEEGAFAFIKWREKHGFHFPQRLRRIYWSIEEAQKIWAMMKCVESDILNEFYQNLRKLTPSKGVNYKLSSGALISIE